MFYTDETLRQQKLKEMRAEIEYERLRKQQKQQAREKHPAKRSLWIIVLSILHLQKKK
ncbi:hypothetical protein BN1080_00517 [Planococcus massiliensis]|uniref:Uncharacterized protein n=1 Tax=Planococcus massiliensis TaxID=1499687 RepID=A0A098EH33_9BACL|nr:MULTISPECIES: hypothetical protein [Planococcus]MCJ1907850.1 hypothetical protein [Planococcus ruber]CEG21604.1 hypothetical protein BN1080_00517 [Planococcus massiliensis]